MSTPNFDTDELIQKFVSQGTPENQARAFVRGIVDAQNQLATTRDLKDLETRLLIKLPAIIAIMLAIFETVHKTFFS